MPISPRDGRRVNADDRYYHEVFSVNEQVGIENPGPGRFKRILDYLDSPDGMEIVLTGRGAPEEIIAVADLVTEMKEIKHYYDKGLDARIGIER